MLAVAIKFSALLLLPFLLLGVGSNRRRVQLITGAAMAAIPLIALSIVLFGLKLPNLQGQTTLLTNFSFPNVVGDIVGAGGGAKWILRVANVGFIVSVLVLLVRSRGDWISRAGWATLALIVSLSWLMPWYLIWLAPLAAIGASTRLRRATGNRYRVMNRLGGGGMADVYVAEQVLQHRDRPEPARPRSDRREGLPGHAGTPAEARQVGPCASSRCGAPTACGATRRTRSSRPPTNSCGR